MNCRDLRKPPTHSQLSPGQPGKRRRVGGGKKKKSLIRGLSHWVCRVNPHAGPSVVLLPSDVTAQGQAAATETRGEVGGAEGAKGAEGSGICLILLCKEV